AVVIKEGPAARARGERPSEAVLHQSGPELTGVDWPKLLQPDSVFLRVAPVLQPESLDEPLGQRPARPLGDQGVFSTQLHPADETRLRLSVAPDAHVAGRNPEQLALLAEERFARRKPGIDLDAKGLRARAEPADHGAQRSDKGAVI